MPLACLEPGFATDFMARRSARKLRLAVPHDLAAQFQIPLSVPVSAEMRDCAHRVAEPLRRLQAVFRRAVAQEGEFRISVSVPDEYSSKAPK